MANMLFHLLKIQSYISDVTRCYVEKSKHNVIKHGMGVNN